MITTLTGSNQLLLGQKLKQLIGDFSAQYGELAVEKLDSEDSSYEQVQGAVESQPFLSPKKMVIINSPSANKQISEDFEKLLSHVADTTEVIIVDPRPDKRSSYYKLLKKQTEVIEFNDVDARDLPVWLIEEAKNLGGQLSIQDARYLVDRVGSNQQFLQNEVKKLLNYDPKITKQTIELLTEQTHQSTVFQLMDAVFSGHTKRALELYEEQRIQKVEPLAIIGMLAWQLHILALIKVAGSRTSSEIVADTKLNPYVVQKTQAIARKLTLSDVKKLVREVNNLDERLKTTSIDADEAFKMLLIDISGRF